MEKDTNDFFGDFEFNYAVVMHGKLAELQKVKAFLERQDDIAIRYQTLDRGKIFIQRERGDAP